MHFSSHFLCILFGIHFTILYAKPNSFYLCILDEIISQYKERNDNILRKIHTIRSQPGQYDKKEVASINSLH